MNLIATMRPYIHTIDPEAHNALLIEKRRDPVTKESLSVGDRIVFCARCKSAFLLDSWIGMGSSHCSQSRTLKTIRINNTLIIGTAKKNLFLHNINSVFLPNKQRSALTGLALAVVLTLVVLSLFGADGNLQSSSLYDYQKKLKPNSWEYMEKTEATHHVGKIRELGAKVTEMPEYKKSPAVRNNPTEEQSRKSLTPRKRFNPVARSAFAENIVKREPEDVLGYYIRAFPKKAKRVFFFNHVIGMEGQTISHRWEYEGNVEATVKLYIGSDSYRTKSSKFLEPGKRGRWEVVVLNSDGEQIHSDSFVYR